MASVILNDKTLRDPRLLALMEETGRRRGELLGVLSLFWLSTRKKRRMSLTAAAAPDFLALPKAECSAFFDAMLRAGYLEERDGVLYIPENVRYLEKAGTRQAAARKAGQASAQKRAAQKRPKKTPAPKPAALVPAPPDALAHSPQTPTTPGSAAFAAYAEAYVQRWGNPPLRDARINALFVQIAKRLGAEAPAIMRFYVAHDDRQYVHKLHPVEFALRDAQALYAQYKRQSVVTYAEAQAAERGDNLRTQAVRRQLDDIARGAI